MRLAIVPPLDNQLGYDVDENANEEHSDDAAVLLSRFDPHASGENLGHAVFGGVCRKLSDGDVDEGVNEFAVHVEACAAPARDKLFQRGVGHFPVLHDFPVPLQTGQTVDTLPSPTRPVPRQFSQSPDGAGTDPAVESSAYLPATATNGRRSAGAEHPTVTNAIHRIAVLYISHGPVCGKATTRPAGNARQCDALTAIDRVGERPIRPVRDKQRGSHHSARSRVERRPAILPVD